jgi:hypothetical protein
MFGQDPLLVPRVSLVDSSTALALFQSTVMSGFIQGDATHYTADCVRISLIGEAPLQRGFDALVTHFGKSRMAHPAILRIDSFVGLLRCFSEKPSEEWDSFQEDRGGFTAFAYAIAWCPLVVGRPFGQHVFMRYAKACPLTLSLISEKIQ